MALRTCVISIRCLYTDGARQANHLLISWIMYALVFGFHPVVRKQRNHVLEGVSSALAGLTEVWYELDIGEWLANACTPTATRTIVSDTRTGTTTGGCCFGVYFGGMSSLTMPGSLEGSQGSVNQKHRATGRWRSRIYDTALCRVDPEKSKRAADNLSFSDSHLLLWNDRHRLVTTRDLFEHRREISEPLISLTCGRLSPSGVPKHWMGSTVYCTSDHEARRRVNLSQASGGNGLEFRCREQ